MFLVIKYELRMYICKKIQFIFNDVIIETNSTLKFTFFVLDNLYVINKICLLYYLDK